CSLSRSVHGEHSRKTTLNSTHCSSSHEFEEVSNTLRTVALTADMMTAARISHARRLPVQRVNASMSWLNFKSDCNDSPPTWSPAVLTTRSGAGGLSCRAGKRQVHHFSAPLRR